MDLCFCTVIDGVLLLWWQDKYPDTNLLDVSEVELHDLQMFEDNPVVVVKFSCQQIRQGLLTHTTAFKDQRAHANATLPAAGSLFLCFTLNLSVTDHASNYHATLVNYGGTGLCR